MFQPLLNLLVLLYNFLGHDVGLAIIAMTFIIRLILYPSFKHQLESQRKLTALQPKLQEIKEKYKNDREQQSRALMEFYRANKVNPLGSCLPLIIQLVVLIGLFQVFRQGLDGSSLDKLYPFVKSPGTISTMFFGLFDLRQPNIPLAVLTGIFQYIQSRQMAAVQPKPPRVGSADAAPDLASVMSKQMMYVLPVMTVFFGATLQSGLTLYWLVTTLFSIGQQYLIMRNKQPELPITLT